MSNDRDYNSLNKRQLLIGWWQCYLQYDEYEDMYWEFEQELNKRGV